MIFRAAADERKATSGKRRGELLRVAHNLRAIFFKGRRRSLAERDRDRSRLVIVRPAL